MIRHIFQNIHYKYICLFRYLYIMVKNFESLLKDILIEQVTNFIGNMKFPVDVIFELDIETTEHGMQRIKGERFGKFESQTPTPINDVMRVIETFRKDILKQYFLGNLKLNEQFAIDSKNAGFGMALSLGQRQTSKTNKFYLTITTLARHTSLRPYFKAYEGELVFLDGGVIKRFSIKTPENIQTGTEEKKGEEPKKSSDIRMSNQFLHKKK
jgi:hypothetical protein